jgi:hypothetical protein
MLAGHTAISGRDHHNRRVINAPNVVEGFGPNWPLQKFSGPGAVRKAIHGVSCPDLVPECFTFDLG